MFTNRRHDEPPFIRLIDQDLGYEDGEESNDFARYVMNRVLPSADEPCADRHLLGQDTKARF